MVTHQIVAYLIALAVGYWVLTLATKEKGNNQKIGRVIGWVIILVAAGGLVCSAACRAYCHLRSDSCTYSSACPWTGHGMANCPDMKGKGMMGGMAPETQEKTK
jgi:hypothetical protein